MCRHGIGRWVVPICALLMGAVEMSAQGTQGGGVPVISVKGLDAAGVELVSPVVADFDARVRKLHPAWADLALRCKPQLTILANHSRRTVVAYSVSFTTFRPDGQRQKDLVHFKYPDAVGGAKGAPQVMPRGLEVWSGEERLVGRGFEIEPDQDNGWLKTFCEGERQAFADAREVEIALDAVLFDDGTLAGANESRLDEHFVLYLKAKQAAYRQVVELVEGGNSVDKAFLVLASQTPRPNASPQEMSEFYAIEAATEARAWRRRLGDERAVEAFKRALQFPEYVVRK